jgi:hypothetical protein
MDIKKLMTEFAIAFGVTLIVSAIVTFAWGLIAQGVGTIDWETSFRTATVFGVIFTVMGARNRKGI